MIKTVAQGWLQAESLRLRWRDYGLWPLEVAACVGSRETSRMWSQKEAWVLIFPHTCTQGKQTVMKCDRLLLQQPGCEQSLPSAAPSLVVPRGTCMVRSPAACGVLILEVRRSSSPQKAQVSASTASTPVSPANACPRFKV